MEQAVEIVESIMQNREYYKDVGLVFPKYVKKWKKFNLLVGENGSGKSRILKILEKRVPPNCIVVNLDFSNHIQSNESEDILANRIIFNNADNDERFLDLLGYLDNQIVSVFDALFTMENTDNKLFKKRAQDYLNELSPAIENILHREITVEKDGICLCKENRKITVRDEWELFSPGEKSILRIIFAVLVIKLVNKPCILLIDELETHLHPNAQIETYNLLKKTLEESVSDYCVCIASHSVFLLPLFEIHELVYMNNGEIKKINGSIYQQIYDDLTGEGDKTDVSLTDFLYSMSAWQYAEYLAECFVEPQTVDEADQNDEQALKFVEVLKKMYGRKKTLEVLDFGAGSARIGRCINLMIKNNKVSELASKFKYHIYDRHHISDEFKENVAWMGRAYCSEEDIKPELFTVVP